MDVNPSLQTAMPFFSPLRLLFRSTYFLSREVVGGQQSSYKTDVDLKHGYLCILQKKAETVAGLFMFVRDIRALVDSTFYLLNKCID